MLLWREAHFDMTIPEHLNEGAFLEVAMWKKRTRLWREAHFEVKMSKA